MFIKSVAKWNYVRIKFYQCSYKFGQRKFLMHVSLLNRTMNQNTLWFCCHLIIYLKKNYKNPKKKIKIMSKSHLLLCKFNVSGLHQIWCFVWMFTDIWRCARIYLKSFPEELAMDIYILLLLLDIINVAKLFWRMHVKLIT